MTSLAILLGVFLFFLVLGVPMVFSLTLSALAMLWSLDMISPHLVVQRMFAGIDSFPMMAIPFFMLAGSIMEQGGISSRLVRFSNYLVGWITGGLAHVSVVAAMFFAGITGSAVADTSAIGAAMIPMMKKRGFDARFSASLVAAAGVVGPILPPSIPAVIYGVIAGVSIGKLFLGGVVPGIIMGASLMLVSYIQAKRHHYPREPRPPSARVFLRATLDASGALIMPVIIVGGILSGIFTATEAAVVAAVYAFIAGKFIYRELQWQQLPEIFFRAGLSTAMILIIVGVANLVGYILALERIPLALAQWLSGAIESRVVILLLLNIVLLVVGCFIDGGSAMIIFTPVLMPLIEKFKIDPVFFGVLMTVNLMIGTITPPVGLSLFVAQDIAGITLEQICRSIVPFFLVEVGTLLLITYVPDLVMFLPNLLWHK
ncbi:MAG TPA: TRAP transporter large permease [Deltaproteobacteria bacterium]|nr:TRAP transporter large permease [Deltaproteobacteria bacterium]